MVESNQKPQNTPVGGTSNLADARLVQKALIGTKIPMKRSFVQQQQRKRRAAYRDNDDSDQMDEDRDRETRAEKDTDGLQNKRQNTGTQENEYESPDDEPAQSDVMTEERAAQLRDTVSQSITDSAKVLPIAKHKTEIITKLDRNRVVIISGDTGCGKTT